MGPITRDPLDPTDVVADPLFCGVASGDFTLAAASPAAPAFSSCGRLAGAFPVGCTSVPTLISAFRAHALAGSVELSWELISDDALMGLRIGRHDVTTDRMDMLPEGGLMPATARRFVDETVHPGHEYEYTLVVVRQEGGDVRSVPARVTTSPPSFSLAQNVPNPFRPRTEISYMLAESADVRLEVFTVDGKRVRTLVSAFQTAGTRAATWDGRDSNGRRLASGVYFYRLRAGSLTFTRKMSLLR